MLTIFFFMKLYLINIINLLGYGNIACNTAAGRTACMLYAMIGIPLALTVLGSLGNALLRFIHRLSDNFSDGADYLGNFIFYIFLKTLNLSILLQYCMKSKVVYTGILEGIW